MSEPAYAPELYPNEGHYAILENDLPDHDLRTAPRVTAHVPLQVWIPDVLDVVLYSNMMDRSRGGFCLHSAIPLDPGTDLYVRPEDAQEDATWVPLAVRHCQPDTTGWALGCQFTSPNLVLE